MMQSLNQTAPSAFGYTNTIKRPNVAKVADLVMWMPVNLTPNFHVNLHEES
jgi:hypothetical protein